MLENIENGHQANLLERISFNTSFWLLTATVIFRWSIFVKKAFEKYFEFLLIPPNLDDEVFHFAVNC